MEQAFVFAGGRTGSVMNTLPVRKHIRRREFDYSAGATHFVTICVQERAHVFGEIHDGEMHLSPAGAIVGEAWARTITIRHEVIAQAFCVMPNHVHALFTIDPTALPGTPLPDDTAALQIGPTGMREPIAARKAHSLATIVGGFKGDATRSIRRLQGNPDLCLWQYRFHDHIVRTDQEFDTIHAYINANPERWQEDRYR